MSGFDDLCACFAVCCTCCCVSCNEASGLFCFYKCCNCRPRRTMDDNEFERTVEQLYAHNKDGSPADPHGPPHTHVLELQPRSGGKDGKDRAVSAQPAPRPSMEAPPRRSGEAAAGAAAGERIPGEPRSERRERTREWVHAHSASEPGLDAPARPRDRSRSRPRSKSHADGGERGERAPRVPEPVAGGSMRGPKEKERSGRPSDAQAYMDAWKRSQEGEREGVEGSAAREEPKEEKKLVERPDAIAAAPPRLDIPASLRPGRPSSWTPSQLQFEPQAAGESGGAP